MLGCPRAEAGEVLRLTRKNWGKAKLEGKEIDAIYGDWVLRNDRIVAVIADTLPGRDANLHVVGIGGTLIDFMRRGAPNDQLTHWDTRPKGFALTSATPGVAEGERVELTCRSDEAPGKAWIEVHYRLEDGSDVLEVETVLHAPADSPATLQAVDGVVVGGTFQAYTDAHLDLAWIEDPWFDAAYGVLAPEGARVRGRLARSKHAPGPFVYLWEGKAARRAPAGGEARFTRRLFCAPNGLELRTQAGRKSGRPVRTVELIATSPSGPVADAQCQVRSAGRWLGSGRPDTEGRLNFSLPPGPAKLQLDGFGRPTGILEIQGADPVRHTFELEEPAWLEGQFTDEQGQPFPCGIQIVGRDGTPSPQFFPDSGDTRIHSTIYTADGRFRQALRPGKYTAMASRGPEYDVARVDFQAERGGTTRITGKLVRTVDTKGWIAADLHGHSSPSGDSYSSPLGRLLSLACTGVEFSPRTEHNRIVSFRALLRSSGLDPWLATTPSIELTGDGIRTHHNIAFPLIPHPHTQGGGAPLPDEDPVAQIRRLAEWDDGSEKLVVLCHPALIRVLYDRDRDGKYDGGYPGLIDHADVVEVPPLERIFDEVVTGQSRISTWMQLMNFGLRKPGIMSGDQHKNAGGGLARTYVKSHFDDPAQLPVLHVVRNLKAGHAMMTSGPFLEASVVGRVAGRAEEAVALPGDEIRLAPGERATLELRVQCANWYDIDRVQVFRNGRPVPEWNFTRAEHPIFFGDGPERFRHSVPLDLSADAHLIVCAIGENSHMGSVMPLVLSGRTEVRPIAVTNPIFVDTDGDGFTPNRDDLGTPIPMPGGDAARGTEGG